MFQNAICLYNVNDLINDLTIVIVFILVTYSAIFLIFLVISNAETKSSETKETRFGPLTKGSYKLPKGIDQFSLTLFQVIFIF